MIIITDNRHFYAAHDCFDCDFASICAKPTTLGRYMCMLIVPSVTSVSPLWSNDGITILVWHSLPIANPIDSNQTIRKSNNKSATATTKKCNLFIDDVAASSAMIMLSGDRTIGS